MSDFHEAVERVRDDLQSLADHCRELGGQSDYGRGLNDGGGLAYQTAASRLTLLLEQTTSDAKVKCNGKCDGAAYEPDQEHPFIADPDCPRHGEQQARFDPTRWPTTKPPSVGTATALVRTPQWGDYL